VRSPLLAACSRFVSPMKYSGKLRLFCFESYGSISVSVSGLVFGKFSGLFPGYISGLFSGNLLLGDY
jgi:hypothetical protein